MTIGTGQVSVSAIALELSRGYGANSNISFGDWSRKLWKGGPTDYATFKEVRSYGSNCAFSTVVTAQGTSLRSQTDPYAEIAANGMNATPCGFGEWKGYTHEYNASTETNSTIGRFRIGTDGTSIAAPSISHVAHAHHRHNELDTGQNEYTVNSIGGIAIWAEKDTTNTGTVYIKLADVYGSYDNDEPSGETSTTELQQLGSNDGADQTTTANTTGTSLPSVTLMKFTGAVRITGCVMSLQSGLDSSAGGNHSYINDLDGGTYSGAKVVTIDHDGTPGATSTTTLGSTKIGYDICMGGGYRFVGDGNSQNLQAWGVKFTFTATNNDEITIDEHSVTVYVGLTIYARHRSSGGGCFALGTLFLMNDDSYKAIEDIRIGDEIYGGIVTAARSGFSNIAWYSYKGVHVTHNHFVFENGIWMNVEDSSIAIPIEPSDMFYTVVTTNHRLYSINDTTFSDDAAFDYDHPVWKNLSMDAHEDAKKEVYDEMLNILNNKDDDFSRGG